MTRLARTALVLGISLSSAASPRSTAQTEDDWVFDRIEWSASLASIVRVTLENRCGDLRIRLADSEEIELSGLSQRQREDTWRAGVHEERSGENTRIEVACGLAEAAGVARRGQIWPRRRVDVTVYVPEHVSVSARTVQGSIDARGLRRHMRLRSEEGDLAAEADGSIDGFTASGRIRARLRGSGNPAASRLETVTGEITVFVSSTAGLTVQMQSAGSLEADFALDLEDAGGDGLQTARVVLGSGAAELFLHSVQGNLALRRADG